MKVVVEFGFVVHEVIVSAVPEADVHFAIGNSDFALLDPFSVAIFMLNST